MNAARHSAAGLGLFDGALPLGPALAPETAITGIAADSRVVEPGMIFAAIKGSAHDGACFIGSARDAGACAALCSLEGAVTALQAGVTDLPLLVVDDPRLRLSQIAARLAGAQPDTVVAITGTSGKTSTADFLRQIWAALGVTAACFGTTGVTAPGLDLPGSLTTPDPVALHKLLAKLAEHDIGHAAMEASSHGLDQRRLDGVRIAAAALTNIARDHMDYHPTAEHYAAAKLRLFADLLPEGGVSVVNADDPIFPLVADLARARDHRLIPVGEGEASSAGFHILGTRYDDAGQTVKVTWRGEPYAFRLPLIGAFQARNVLTAAALAIGCGSKTEDVIGTLPLLTGVRGRMEFVARRANGAAVYVDYAHKPDAIVAALTGMRPHVKNRLHIVIGAGGDRDPGKRPLMGEAAAAHADAVIVTDDNPRSEDPATIRKAILAAAPGATEIGDRGEAILRAVDSLGPGDVLLIAGKGHESGQTVGDTVIPFDDAEQVRSAVEAVDGDPGLRNTA